MNAPAREDAFGMALDALRDFKYERAEEIGALWDRATLDAQADEAERDIDEACKLIRRAKHRLGYYPEPDPRLEHRCAGLAKRIRETQTTLDLVLEELGWEPA